MINSEVLVGLPGYEVTNIEEIGGGVRCWVRYEGVVSCPHCEGLELRVKGRRYRRLRHESIGTRICEWVLETRKWLCRACGRFFWQRFPGILPRRRATEPFRRSVFQDHWDGICRSTLALRERIGSATVARWFLDYLKRQVAELKGAACPRILGIDEHFFTRKGGYATTLCNLARNSVFDLVLGRSEASLEAYLNRLPGKGNVQVVCMDLSNTYRVLVKKHFPKARIVADRFHVVRLINHHFLACWKQIDPVGARNRGLISMMRRHEWNLSSEEQSKRLRLYLAERPGLEAIYDFKQELCKLMLVRSQTRKECERLAKRFVDMVPDLLHSSLPSLVTLGETLNSWSQEIACMWRFTKNNGITEGFHNKMEAVARQAYGFRNFENYRLRVRVLCSGINRGVRCPH